MKIFLFEEPEQVTDSYHSGGSVMVVASSKTSAKQLLEDYPGIILSADDWTGVREFELAPVGSGYTPEVFIFPDSGCC